jgi:hypothetical protein
MMTLCTSAYEEMGNRSLAVWCVVPHTPSLLNSCHTAIEWLVTFNRKRGVSKWRVHPMGDCTTLEVRRFLDVSNDNYEL